MAEGEVRGWTRWGGVAGAVGKVWGWDSGQDGPCSSGLGGRGAEYTVWCAGRAVRRFSVLGIDAWYGMPATNVVVNMACPLMRCSGWGMRQVTFVGAWWAYAVPVLLDRRFACCCWLLGLNCASCEFGVRCHWRACVRRPVCVGLCA